MKIIPFLILLCLISCQSQTDINVSNAKTEVKTTHKLKLQETCPYQGTPIDPYKYIEYKGQYIHVCCEPCLKLVEKDPEKAIKILKEKYGEKPEKIKN